MHEIIDRLSKINHGFRPIELEAKKIFNLYSLQKVWTAIDQLLENENYQARSLAVFLLGYIATKDSKALHILKTKVSLDKSWQVQEILAKSFDQFCSDKGYEHSLIDIDEWLNDENTNVRRAVTEGLRIWTGRPYFKEYPETAIKMISQNKASESEYLRKSVGNALRDISKKHKELIQKEISTWDLSNKLIHSTYKYVTKNEKN